MSLVLDPNKPWSEREKAIARSTGRGALIVANERRFPNGEVQEGDTEGEPQNSAQFDHQGTEVRQNAAYDVGGAPLPGAVLDYDTGRAFGVDENDNAVLLEPALPGNTSPGTSANPSPWGDGVPDEGDVDDDIVEYVQGLPNVKALKDELDKAGVPYSKEAKRDELEDALAIHLYDKRHGTESHPGAPVEPVIYVDPETGDKVEKPANKK